MKIVPNITDADSCKSICCDNVDQGCQGIMWDPGTLDCTLTPRFVEPEWGAGGKVLCDINPPPVYYKAMINMSQPCFSLASGYITQPFNYPSTIENTGNISGVGEWYHLTSHTPLSN